MTASTWLVGGLAAVAIAGVVLLAHALLADRARGRRRCPRCWYELVATAGLRCPECGHDARRERRLRRTRRRWGRALLALLVAMIATGAATHVRIQQRGGWIKAGPNVVVVLLVPDASIQLRQRIGARSLRPWETRLLVRRCVALLADPDTRPAELLAIMKILNELAVVRPGAPYARSWRDLPRLTGPGRDRLIDAALGLLEHDDPRVRDRAIWTLLREQGPDAHAVPALFGYLSDPQIGWVARSALDRFHDRGPDFKVPMQLAPPSLEFYDRLGACGRDVAAALPVFREGLGSRHGHVRLNAITGLAHFGNETDRELVLAAFDDPMLRPKVLRSIALLGLDDRTRGLLGRGLDDDAPDVRSAAISALGELGDGAAAFHERIERVVRSDPSRDLREQAWHVFAVTGGDGHVAARALGELYPVAGSDYKLMWNMGHQAELAWTADFTAPAPEPVFAMHLEHPDRFVRSAAAYAIGAVNGDIDTATRVLVGELLAGGPWTTTENIPELGYLSRLAESDALPGSPLIRMLESDIVNYRAAAAGLLGCAVDTPRVRAALETAAAAERRSPMDTAPFAAKLALERLRHRSGR